MKTLEKRTCNRCGGSGSYSFNLIDGTKCYGCMGSGFKMVDVKAEARNKKAREKREAIQAARCKINIEAMQEIKEKFNPIYGPFDLTTELGIAQLDGWVGRETGKDLCRHRDELLKSRGLI